MTIDFVSVALIALIAAATPFIARLIPGRAIPETVFLLLIGALVGPHMAGLITVDETVSFLSELGLAFLFLLAGYEIDPKNLTGSQGKRGLATWVISLGLAFLAVRLSPNFSITHIDGLAVAIALTTTALGTLMPIMKERGLMGTPVGNSILSYGTWGELGPIFAMAILLSTRQTWQTVLILAIFVALAVAVALFSSHLRKAQTKVSEFLRDSAESTSQTVVRLVILLLVSLVAFSALFDLDIVLGSFAAGFILRYILPEGNDSLERKLDGIAYGFFIPLFFVVSGAKIDLTAVATQPVLLVGFILMLLIIRALPIYIAMTAGKGTRTMARNSRISVSLYCTTALPIIVAVTSVAVDAGAMSDATASVLVSAGALTVLIMPLLASLIYRISDAEPIKAVQEIAHDPKDASAIVRDHIALERMMALAKKRREEFESLAHELNINVDESALSQAKTLDDLKLIAKQRREAFETLPDEEKKAIIERAQKYRAAHADRVAQRYAIKLARRLRDLQEEFETKADAALDEADKRLGEAETTDKNS